MAMTEVLEGDRGPVVRTVEFKRELQKLLKAIVDEDDFNPETVDRAQKMLVTLKDLKKKKKTADSAVRCQEKAVPDEFKCPLSKQIMRDPVIVSSGLTYDRPYIQNWLKSGNRTCPKTEEVLSCTTLTPNYLIREMINDWCKENEIKLPEYEYNEEEVFTEDDREKILSLLKKMSSTLPDQKEAAKELRLLTKRTPSSRALFAETPDAIRQLVASLSPGVPDVKVDHNLQEDVVTTIMNISIHENNKKLVAETPSVIPMLIEAVRSGTVETRSNSAAALFTLCALDSNRASIGKAGALEPLIKLLDEGHAAAMKDAASAIFSMCLLHENKSRAVRDGAIGVIMKKIKESMQVSELLTTLALLSTNQKAIEQLVELDAVPCLLSFIRETSSARNKENCISILHAICYSDRTTWAVMREEEQKYHTISQLADDGTSRAKRKAEGILERLKRAANIIHTA